MHMLEIYGEMYVHMGLICGHPWAFNGGSFLHCNTHSHRCKHGANMGTFGPINEDVL